VWLAFGPGCQVRGLIGSNVDGGAGGEGTSGDDTGVTTGSTSVNETSLDSAGATSSVGTTADDESGEFIIFDVGNRDVPSVCAPPSPMTCDNLDDDPWHAMGMGCDGDVAFERSFEGSVDALTVHAGALGALGTFAPRDGEKFTVLSTGRADELPLTPEELQLARPGCTLQTCPSTDHGGERRLVLPEPLDVRKVAEDRDCSDDPELVGGGDCSNTLWDQWLAGDGAYDYAELRMRMQVPEYTDGFSYDFAFFSSEYPLWFNGHQSAWNDMYVAWLESESWTGNISFDETGSPISINSVFLDYMDGSTEACPNCVAPELQGFAMQGHAGTKWLTTTAPVVAGEEIELVFAIFDLSDGAWDTLVILDNFDWTCSGAPPITVPAG
jgi:hypothetical protein